MPDAFLIISSIAGAVAGAVSAAIFHYCSPREALDESRRAAADVRKQLETYDGEFEGAWPLIRASLTTALKPLILSLKPLAFAMIPVALIFTLLVTLNTGASDAWQWTFIGGAFLPALFVQWILRRA